VRFKRRRLKDSSSIMSAEGRITYGWHAYRVRRLRAIQPRQICQAFKAACSTSCACNCNSARRC